MSLMKTAKSEPINFKSRDPHGQGTVIEGVAAETFIMIYKGFIECYGNKGCYCLKPTFSSTFV